MVLDSLEGKEINKKLNWTQVQNWTSSINGSASDIYYIYF